jgi:uncharacterized coiled-coil protein SlyX
MTSAMFSLRENMFCHEVDLVIASLERRLAEQRRTIEALKAAHKPVRAAQQRLRQLDRHRGRLEMLRGHFVADAPPRNHRP